MTIQALINKIFRANQTQNNTVSWSGSNGLKSIQEDIVSTLRERTFFTVPTTSALASQGFNNAILCYVQDEAFYRWSATGTPNGTTIFPANDGGVWIQETIGQTDGTVTSVSALTINSTGTDLSSTVANPTTTPVITLSVPTASALNRGVLSSSDWTAFNSKQDAITLTTTGTSGAATLVGATLNIPQYQSVITNPVTGTGTSGQVAYFNGTSSITSNAAFAFTPTSQLLVNNSVTASSAIARGTNLTPTLTAAANNDVLVGLDITPTFTNGAFTGVTNWGLRVASPIQVTYDSTSVSGLNLNTTVGTIGIFNNISFTTSGTLRGAFGINNQSGEFRWNSTSGGYYPTIYSNGSEAMRIPATRNVLIGTTTDAGFKLDVNGTARIVGVTTFNNNITQTSGTATFGNGILLDATRRIFGASTITYQSNDAASQHYFKNEISGGLSGTLVTIGNGSGTFGTTSASNFLNISGRLATASGTNNLTSILLNHTVENTGTYTGTIRGIYYAPLGIIGTGFTHRAIETVTGDIYFGSTSGNVGIGTAPTSSYKLDVNGTGRFQTSITIGGAADATLFFPNTTSGHQMRIYTQYASNAMVIFANGYNLNLSGGGGMTSNFCTTITGSNGSAALTVQQGNVAWSPVLVVNAIGSTGTRFNTNGNVLIGTTTDAGYKLDIFGTTRIYGASTSSLMIDTVGTVDMASSITFRQNSPNWSSSIGTHTSGGGLHYGLQFKSQPSTVNFVINRDGSTYFGGFGLANSSSLVELSSTTKGFLQPRMTTTQRNAIATPATGLAVYNTTTNTEDYYNGTTWVSLQTSVAAVKSFGAFQEDTTQVAPASNVGYGIKFSTPDISGHGVTMVNDPLGDPTYIEMANAGFYNIQFSCQFQNANNSLHDVTIWLRKNGNTTAEDIPATAGFVSVPNKHGSVPGHCIVAWNYFVEAAAGDFFQLVWSTTDAINVTMEFYPAGSPPPSAASAILTVNQVN